MQQQLQDGSGGGQGGPEVPESVTDGRKTPSVNTRRRLLIAGASEARRGDVSDSALAITNAFYAMDLGEPRWDVTSEYWQLMVCILAERCARAEHLAEIERSRRFGGGESDDKEPVTEEWLQAAYDAERGDQKQYANRWCILSRINPDSYPLFLERSWKEPDVWIANIDGDYFPVDIHVREQVRLLVRMCHEL